MTYHIVNGDCLAKQLTNTDYSQNLIICRECLVDGDVAADNLTKFWQVRANHIATAYGATNYDDKVIKELNKVSSIPSHAEVCLWFEDDLFCQVNLWFIVTLFSSLTNITLYRVFPPKSNHNHWQGFADCDAKMLSQCHLAKIKFSHQDKTLAINLWHAYQKNDLDTLMTLANSHSNCFRYLKEVCQAQADRFSYQQGIPSKFEQIVTDIFANTADFNTAFKLFSEQHGIYGLGDLQMKIIYDKQSIKK